MDRFVDSSSQRQGATLPETGLLPAPAGPIIGRDRQIADAMDLLVNQQVRLLTLTGPGGIGKTRLAIALSHRLAEKMERPVTMVALESVRDSGVVAGVIARAVGILDKTGDSEADVIRWLAGDERVLVLDNFEQLLAATPFLGRILSNCPGVRILVTSRHAPLHLAGERIIEVGPLEFPVDLENEAAIDPGSYPAIQYFLQHAPSVRWKDSAPAVVRICRRLDGIPLALELAGARVGLLSVEEIADQTSGWMEILTRGSLDAPERQRTMQEAIDWSYRLLDPSTQRVFRGLSVFAGDFSRDAASEVAAASPGQLSALLDSRLLSVSTSRTRSSRFRLLEPVRDFVLQEAERHGELAQFHCALAQWAVALVRSIYRTPFSAQIFTNEGRMLERMLEDDRANLLSALRWMVENRDVAGSLTVAAAMSDYWYIALRPGEGLACLSAALQLAQSVEAPFSQGLAKVSLGYALQLQIAGKSDAAKTQVENILAVSVAAGDVTSIAECHGVLSYVALNRGEYERSIESSLRALDVFRTPEFEDRPWQVDLLEDLALAHTHLGDLERAGQYAEEAVALAGVFDTSIGSATALRALGDVRIHQGRFMDAILAHTDAFAAGVMRYGRSSAETWHNVCQGMAAATTIAWYAFPDDPSMAIDLARKTEEICHRLGASMPDKRISYGKIRDAMRAGGLLSHRTVSADTVSTMTLNSSLAGLRSAGYELRRRLAPDEIVFPIVNQPVFSRVDPEMPNILSDSISPVQLETIRAIANGKSVKEIAVKDGVRQSSVYHRVQVVREKWGLPDHTTLLDLAVFAVRHGVA